MIQRQAQGHVRFSSHRGVLLRLCQGEESLRQLARRLRGASGIIKVPQAAQGWKALRRFLDLLAQRIRPGVDLFDLGCINAVCDHQDGTQSHVHIKLVMRALGTARQGLYQGQTVFEMRFGLLVGALVEGVLARTLPVGNGLGRATGRCGMMRDELGLRGDDVGELLLQDLDQALVVVLPCLLQ